MDKTRVSWRGRLSFKQYIPDKAYKYEVKMSKAADTKGYTWDFVVYTGKQNPAPNLGHTQTVVEKKLKQGEIHGLQKGDGIMLIKYTDNRDILMISTKPPHTTALADIGTAYSSDECIMKPQEVLHYNEGRQGTDFSDQSLAYHTCLTRSIKWCQKVAFELIFETSVVGSYLIHKENYATNDTSNLQSRESVVRSLFHDVSNDHFKTGSRQQSTGHLQCKLVAQKLEEMEGNTPHIRRR